MKPFASAMTAGGQVDGLPLQAFSRCQSAPCARKGGRVRIAFFQERVESGTKTGPERLPVCVLMHEARKFDTVLVKGNNQGKRRVLQRSQTRVGIDRSVDHFWKRSQCSKASSST